MYIFASVKIKKSKPELLNMFPGLVASYNCGRDLGSEIIKPNVKLRTGMHKILLPLAVFQLDF